VNVETGPLLRSLVGSKEGSDVWYKPKWLVRSGNQDDAASISGQRQYWCIDRRQIDDEETADSTIAHLEDKGRRSSRPCQA